MVKDLAGEVDLRDKLEEPILCRCERGHYTIRRNARVRCNIIYCAATNEQITSLYSSAPMRTCRERVKVVANEAVLSVWRLGGIKAVLEYEKGRRK